jgi:hypothetical protein
LVLHKLTVAKEERPTTTPDLLQTGCFDRLSTNGNQYIKTMSVRPEPVEGFFFTTPPKPSTKNHPALAASPIYHKRPAGSPTIPVGLLLYACFFCLFFTSGQYCPVVLVHSAPSPSPYPSPARGEGTFFLPFALPL